MDAQKANMTAKRLAISFIEKLTRENDEMLAELKSIQNAQERHVKLVSTLGKHSKWISRDVKKSEDEMKRLIHNIEKCLDNANNN